MKLLEIYKILLEHFGRQNWWSARYFPDKKWEICVGAILTQHTNWRNVEKVLEQMKDMGIVSAEDVLKAENLEEVIKPAGFYKQKAERLGEFARFFLSNRNFRRGELLKLKGIGVETADSILLYAFGKPYFVVDAYTKRVFKRLGFLKGRESYEEIREMFEENLPRDRELYKEFHALIVELGKRFCRKEPKCSGCPLNGRCK